MQIGWLAVLFACSAAQKPPRAEDVLVRGNDNTHPAGTLRDGTLSLDLEIGEADWRWEQQLPAYRVLAFAERNGPLTTPGPLVRVREGTRIRVAITNRVARDVVVHGLHARPGVDVPLRVPARSTVETQFAADAPGTYYYWGAVADGNGDREQDDSQLTGAFVVDPARGGPPDRIFVIAYHGQAAPVKLDAWTINGRSWPETERLEYRVGEPVHWRWINATSHHHPMHMHGTYFRVHSRGDNVRDEVAANPPEVVTEGLRPSSTMAMTWSPAQAGNWLFHCHNLFHVMADNRLQLPSWYEDYAKLGHDQHMAGLVLGIHARPHGPPPVRVTTAPRKLALEIGERPGIRFRASGLDRPGLGYSVDGSPVTSPGPVIVLERGRPVEITITSHIAHATQVHWHGIELESYYDGVPHWGGDSRQMTPQIDPGKTFVAKFTPPRAGTFIYHTHFNDYVQLASGLHGPLIVVEPGQRFDPEVDHLFVISRDGFDEENDPILLDGTPSPPPLTLRAGTHRLRFVGITAVTRATVKLTSSDVPVTWRAVAKDGATFAKAESRTAQFMIYPGETYDFELDVDRSADLVLDVVSEFGKPLHAGTRLLMRPR